MTKASFACWLFFVSISSLATEPWSAERLYREGLRMDGSALVGVRANGTSLNGLAAACVNCHRRSGLGTSEGKTVIPPISGEYLFRSRITNGQQIDAPTISTYQRRVAYTPATLATALREGIGSDGQPLSLLMPRYALGEPEIAQLIPYLRGLGTTASAGVTPDTLHFATIITPDADVRAIQGTLTTLEKFFQDRNHIIAGEARPMQHNDRGVMYRVTRRWVLHVWELRGVASTWAAQLTQFQQAQPVFAVISGAGGRDWSPVHTFCEASKVPCLFPNVDTPPLREQDFYSVYFSRGLYLEAELMADALEEAAGVGTGADFSSSTRTHHVIQVLRAGAGLEPVAQHLTERLRQRGWQSTLRVLPREANQSELAAATSAASGADLVLWLDDADIAALPATPSEGVHAWLSGLLGGLEQMPLPDVWKATSSLTYPFELPDRRVVAMRFPEGWFRIKRIALVDPRAQIQTYVACQILSETVGELHATFQPDFLVERLEVMLSHRRLNGLFPRLGLGVNQRFASKGGYLVHFAAGPDRTLVPEGDWRTP